MQICHNLPFLYVLICFALIVFFTKIWYYPHNLVLSGKRRFVLLSEGSEVQVLFGVPEMPKTLFFGILFLNFPSINRKKQPNPLIWLLFVYTFRYTRFLYPITTARAAAETPKVQMGQADCPVLGCSGLPGRFGTGLTLGLASTS